MAVLRRQFTFYNLYRGNYLYYMNYFELFEIPVQLKVNTVDLKNKFYSLSRKYHPDFHSQTEVANQLEVLEKSSLLNKAWKTFQDPDQTIKYVLQLKHLLEEEEKYELPPAFLMEVMEINEQLMDAKMEGDEATIKEVRSIIEKLQKELYEPLKDIIENYQDGFTTEKELLLVKDYYFKKKYLNRILAGLP